MVSNHIKLKGFFTLDIVDEKSGKVEKAFPLKQNLILRQGIDYVAQRSFVENILYCAIGQGTVPPLLTDTGLTNELDRTGDVDSSLPFACLTTLEGNVYSLSKTFRFQTRASPMIVGQIGWSYSPTPGANLFSKSLIVSTAGLPTEITIDVGKYLRVKYTLQLTINPSTAVSGASNITNIIAPSTYAIQLIGLRKINEDGSLGYWDAGNDCNEPSGLGDIFLTTNSTALASFGSANSRSSGTNYTTPLSKSYLGGGRLAKYGSFGKGSAVETTFRSFGVGVSSSSMVNTGFVTLFDANVTKASDFILTLKIIYSWA